MKTTLCQFGAEMTAAGAAARLKAAPMSVDVNRTWQK
jgi:hypothetical protein